MKKFILLFIILPFVSLAFSVAIPNVAIDYGIKQVFPVEKAKYGSKIKVFNPEIKIEDNKFKLKTDYTASILLKKFKGNMYFESNVRFDNMTNDLYLDKVKLVKITDGKHEFMPESNFISTALMNSIYPIVEKKSIYNTKEHSLTKLLPINDITINDNKLLVDF